MPVLNKTVEEVKNEFLKNAQNEKLAKAVLNQIGDDESVFQYTEDYRDASAGVSGFIYYTDTVKFAKDNIFEILKVLNEFENECGVLEKPTEDETSYYNWLAWFALENTIHEIIRFKEDFDNE